MKVLFYATNGISLGHITRELAIAKALRNLTKCDIYFITSTDYPYLISQFGFPVYKIPSRESVLNSSIEFHDHEKLVKRVIQDTILSIDPDIFVVDMFASGDYQELPEILDKIKVKILVLREMKTKFFRSKEIQDSLGLYDRIIIPHTKSMNNISQLKTSVTIGEVMICQDDEIVRKNQSKRYLKIPIDKECVYINFGGGGEQDVEKAISDVIQCLDKYHCLLATGPLYSGKRFSGKNITQVDEYPVMKYLKAADYAISASGYNSFNELMYLGIPTIFLPFSKYADDQTRRARYAEEKNAAICLMDINAASIKKSLGKLKGQYDAYSNNAKGLVPENNASKAANLIIEQWQKYSSMQ